MSSKLWTEEQFNCPVCLDLPNDPVTIPCGHSYCMGCIKDYWSKDDPKGIYSCPQCRQTFCPKPPLSRNTMLAEAVDQLRKGASKSAVRESMRSVRSGASVTSKLSSCAVPCDLCKGKQRAAVKSCLVCMSSYCESHLKPHQTQKALKQHELSPPIGDLAEKICTAHKYLEEFYCRPCKLFVCWLCTSNQHKGHECVSTKAERQDKQKLFGEIQTETAQKLKDRELELRDMRKMMEGVKRSVDLVFSDSEQTLSELQRSVERLQELLEELMEQAHREKVGQAQEVVDSLQEEVKELRRRDSEMKELSRTEDHIHYLKTYESMCRPLDCGELPAVHVNHSATFAPVRELVLDLRERVEDLCNQELTKISKQVSDTSLFTLGHRGGAKGSILKIFSGLGSRSTNGRSTVPSVSSGGRSADRRGIGVGSRGPDVRTRETRDRLSVPETSSRLGPSPRSSPRSSPTPSRRETRSLWNRSSSQSLAPAAVPSLPAAPAPAAPAVPAPPAPAAHAAPPAPAAPNGFSRMASIGNLFRSRRGTGTVNPGLFLDDSPETMDYSAFPGLREISLDSIQAPEPRSREEFLQCKYRSQVSPPADAVALTLDPRTAHRRLLLSEGNTKASLQNSQQSAPDSAQRFDGWTQVLCQSVLAARSYWEVEWRGRGSSVGVVYGSICRKGADAKAGLGFNAQSWSLELSDSCCAAMHDNQKEDISVPYCPRVGVFLDLNAGTLSFYSVSDSMTPLHRFRANFTQPLYAAFGVGSGVGVGLDFALGQFTSSTDSVRLCPM